MGGHIDSVFLTVAAVSGQVATGKLRALAVTGERRIAAMPDTPTFAEAGVKGLEDAGWFALFAPGATPAAVRERVAATVAKIVAEPDSQKRLSELGLQPVGSTPERHRAAWEATLRLVELIVARTGLKLN
ncbi:MAG: Bug family tripartite tricarboxylate transporter substrate binding protein, partial [Pseudomonadota bacterium]